MTDQAVSPDNLATGGTTGADEPLIDPMELEAIFVEVLDALLMNAGMDVEAPIPPEPGVEATPMTGKIIINADTKALLVVDTDAQACAKLARLWGLVGDEGATAEDASDALGELCNLVGATVKTVFVEESHVGIPEVSEGTGPVWESVEATVHHAAGVFVARLGLD